MLTMGRIWGLPQDIVLHAMSGNIFMLAPGGLATIMLSAYFGRLLVLYYFVALTLVTSAWCGAAMSFESYMTARILNGFFSTVTQAVRN